MGTLRKDRLKIVAGGKKAVAAKSEVSRNRGDELPRQNQQGPSVGDP